MRNHEDALIFLHIPKTAGITFRRIVTQQYDLSAHHQIDGEHIEDSVAAFKGLPETRRANVRLLTGHMPFGLHQFLPRRARYITLLRDPIERVIQELWANVARGAGGKATASAAEPWQEAARAIGWNATWAA